MELFEWQQRNQTVPFWMHMIGITFIILAGSFAGLSQHLTMLPLDNVKTHCQAGSQLRLSGIIMSIYSAGGLYNFYSGSSIMAMGCIPAHAIYFSIYEQSKKLLQIGNGQEVGSLLFGVVGAASSLFHDMIMTPTQVIKQRLQLIRSAEKNHKIRNFQLIRSMYKNEGMISFYRSFGINYMMSVPFASTMIFTNESLKIIFGIKEQEHHIEHYLCGGLAGGLASIPTTPFDVIKTKLNTQACINNMCQKKNVCDILNKVQIDYKKIESSKIPPKLSKTISTNKQEIIRYRNILDTTSTIYKEEGLKGFLKGMKMRIAIQSSSSAIAWGVYQSVKNILYKTSYKH